MGEFIVKLEDRYLVWSTIVDAPVDVPHESDCELAEILRAAGVLPGSDT